MAKNIPDSHLLALGSIAVEFGKLEVSLILSISNLLWLEVKGIGPITLLVGGDSFDVLLTKLNKIFIYKLHDDKLINDFGKLFKRLDAIREQRNRYLHSYWTANEKDGILRIKFRKKPDKNNILSDRIKFNTEELLAFVEKIKIAAKDLDDITNEAIEEIIVNKAKERVKKNH